jgi:hypothetical protein
MICSNRTQHDVEHHNGRAHNVDQDQAHALEPVGTAILDGAERKVSWNPTKTFLTHKLTINTDTKSVIVVRGSKYSVNLLAEHSTWFRLYEKDESVRLANDPAQYDQEGQDE